EDHVVSPADSPATTVVSCFGLQRRLSDVSVRRVGSKRDFPIDVATPTDLAPQVIALATNLTVNIGQYLASDASKIGFSVTGQGTAVAASGGAGVVMVLPNSLT